MRYPGYKNNMGTNPRILSIVLLFYLLLMTMAIPVSGDNEFSNIHIREDGWFIKEIGYDHPFEKYDVFWAKVNVTSGGPVDVYFMKCSEANKLRNGTSFKADVNKERVNKTSFEWEKDETGKYCIVVENIDNARENDAVPSETVYADITFGHGDEGHERAMWLIWVYGGIIGLLIIISTVVWYVWYTSR